MMIGMDDSSLRLFNLNNVITTFNKWHFGSVWDISTNLYHCLLATCSSDGAIKCCRLTETSAKKKKVKKRKEEKNKINLLYFLFFFFYLIIIFVGAH